MPETAYNHAIKLDNFHETKVAQQESINPDSLADGQVLVRVDKVALTSNSLSYVIGSQSGLMPWLDLFPAPEGFGTIPCWGFGDVIDSKHPEVAKGERLYGFFPVGSHVILQAGKIRANGFTDIAACRQGVAPFYNEYSYIRNEPGYAPEFEDNMILFRPLFGTSYLLESYCEDHGFFDKADQIIISSASSKTAMGFGYLLRKNHAPQTKAIGLTSERNKDFVAGLNCYDQVITYSDIDSLNLSAESVFFDVAGNNDVKASVHQKLGDALIYSGHVGQTHWDDKDKKMDRTLPGPRPEWWSGPDQLMKLREQHGESGFMKLVQASMIDFMIAAYNWIEIENSDGAQAIDDRVKRMLAGDIDAAKGMILRP